MEKEGDPFYWPCYMTIGPVAGAALCMLVLGLGHPVEDRSCSSEASLELLEEAQPFISRFWSPGSPGRHGLVATGPPPPHSSVTWRG